MNRLRFLFLVPFAIPLALGQPAPKRPPGSLPKKPETLIQSLYQQVVARPPYGDLEGRDMRIFSPYLSRALRHRFESAHACSQDWFRQNPRLDVKAPFAWSESGPFSGANERESPGEFQIEKTQGEKDGSFRIDVRLTYRPIDGGGSWRVEDIVVQQDGHFVVDEVVYLKDKDMDREYRLSDVLAQGCDGPRWVGYKNRPE